MPQNFKMPGIWLNLQWTYDVERMSQLWCANCLHLHWMCFDYMLSKVFWLSALSLFRRAYKSKRKEYHTAVLVACSSPLLRPWARRWINHSSLWRMASATPHLRLPSQSQDIAARDWYQIILLGDRGTCVWTTCPRSLPDSRTAWSWTRDLLSQKSTP